MSTLKRMQSESVGSSYIRCLGLAVAAVTLLVVGIFIGMLFYHYGPGQLLAEKAYYRGAFAGCYFQVIAVERLNNLPVSSDEERARACNTAQKALKDDDFYTKQLTGWDDLFR